jgi:hypothetical protein
LGPFQFLGLLVMLVVVSYPLVAVGAQSFYYRDYGALGFPLVHYHRQSFWAGEVPLWNPLSNCGVPFLAQWGAMVLYPPALIYLLLPLPWSLGIFCLAHVVLAGLGMYLLVLAWTERRFGASFAGIAYAFGGVTLSSLIWPNWVAALGWMPWVILAAERSVERGGGWLIAAAVLGALQMLTGVPEVTLLTWLTVMGLWALCFWHRSSSRWRLPVRALALVGLIAALSAGQLLPFFELLSQSQRDVGFADAKWAMPVWGWGNLIVPLFHCFRSFQRSYAQYQQEFFTSYYAGLAVLALAGLAPFRRGGPRAWLMAVLALLGLVLALGPSGYLYSWLRAVIPSLGLGRYPVKFVVLAAFGLPVLAGFALAHGHPDPRASPRSRLLALGALVLALLAAGLALVWFGHRHPLPYDQPRLAAVNFAQRAVFLLAILGASIPLITSARPRIRWVAQVGVLLILWGDLRFHWPASNPTLPVSFLLPGVAELKPAPRAGESRVFTAPGAGELLLRSRVRDRTNDFLGKRLALWSNLNVLEGVPSFSGAVTLVLRAQQDLHRRVYQGAPASVAGLLDFLAVSHQSSSNNAVEWETRDTRRPWVVAGSRAVFAPAREVLDAITAASFCPAEVLYLSLDSTPPRPEILACEARVEVKEYTAQRIRLTVRAAATSAVSLAQSYHPFWRASVDGQRTPTQRANHAYLAVVVPAGQHEVTLVYRDWVFLGGLAVAGLALAGCGVILVRMNQRAGEVPG